jgi:hypothetical protein
MKFSLLTRASQILVDKIKATTYKLQDCRLYSEKEWHPYGFLGIYAVCDGNVVACISQDIFSAEIEDIKEAEKFIMSRINKLYDN